MDEIKENNNCIVKAFENNPISILHEEKDNKQIEEKQKQLQEKENMLIEQQEELQKTQNELKEKDENFIIQSKNDKPKFFICKLNGRNRKINLMGEIEK